jgi:pyruvate,water dikinase
VSELRDTGLGTYLSETPSTRFPVYTRGNAGEVYPEVVYPLTFSSASQRSGAAMKRVMVQTGAFSAEELHEDVALAMGVFHGYSYLNLSLGRVATDRLPGGNHEDTELQYMGHGEAPEHRAMKGDRNLAATMRFGRYVWRTLGTTEVPELATNDAAVDRWSATLPSTDTASDLELLGAIRGAEDFLLELFLDHLAISTRTAVPFGLLDQLCREVLGDEDLPMRLMGGVGDVSSAAPSGALWDLGRMVAAQPNLTEAFDAGHADVLQRLGSGDAESAFAQAFAEFTNEFGSRGPNEWETACPTWGTNPEMPLAIIDRLRGAPAANDPALRRRAIDVDRQDALAFARRRAKGPVRWLLNRSVASGTLLARSREHSKTTVIRALHEVRLLSRELGRRTADRAGSSDPDDLWFLLENELDSYVANPKDHHEAIAERRAVRARLGERIPPFYFDGAIPSADTWQLRSDSSTAAAVKPGDSIEGIAGCPGKARGRARVVLDPTEPGDLGPGDVLVAPLTDPAWTPLFMSAEAVVVDVGAQLSHAVIVSRELGIPCVVSATDASRRIPDGTLIEVDGTSGTVLILE